MRQLRIFVTVMFLLGLFFFNLGSAYATSGKVVENPDEPLVLVNKTYQLPSSYVPNTLVTPNVAFSSDEEQLQPSAAQALESMFAHAEEADIELRAASGYRSYEYQKDLHQYYVDEYGKTYANEVSAKAGHSEHQTGLAIDVTTPAINNQLIEEFAETNAGQWVSEHAHEYGFIIRYPNGKENITGYKYEPWHLRFVGVEHAQYIATNDLTLEEYLSEKGTHQTYTIQPGDSLWGIAQQYDGLTVEKLLTLNPSVDPYELQVGMELKLNEDDGSDSNHDDHRHTYVIKRGDTLWDIAKRYDNVTVEDIMEVNEGINPAALKINQQINIPTNAENEETHTDMNAYTIKQGDTLWDIAMNYEDISVKDLKNANPSIDPQTLTIGTKINIPE